MGADRARFLETARRIGERLCDSAVWDDGVCEWTGLTPVETAHGYAHQTRRLGPDVYAGAAGVALFLTQLYRFDPQRGLRRTIEGAARSALAKAQAIPPASRSSFAYGWTGIVYAVLESAATLEDETLVAPALALLRRVRKLSPRTQASDMLIGIAGAVPALVALAERRREPGLLRHAALLGEHLLATARRRPEGLSWAPWGPLSELHHDDLTGLAHGASGYAYALLTLYRATGDARYRAAGEDALRYERRWFVAERDNWLDLRYMPGPDGDLNHGDVCQTQWCYGAPGIALVRLYAYALLRRAGDRAEAEQGIRATRADLARYPHNAQPNFSLCHGVAGNGDVLLTGGRILGDASLRADAEAIGLIGMREFADAGAPWPGALPGAEIPGLFTGIAGTGYFYLRLFSETTPSVLLVGSENAALTPSASRASSRKDSRSSSSSSSYCNRSEPA
jgi:lantibiotic biosynthesis protein